MSFAGHSSARVEGFLCVPPGSGRRPAVVYLHGAGGDRRELLVLAVWMARRGAVTLTITAPRPSIAAPRRGLAALRAQRALELDRVIAIRRAVDLLVMRQDVDADRIAFVGWSAGARTGAIVAGVEHRIRSLVLMSGGATPLRTYGAAAPPELREKVVGILRDVDPLRWIAHAAPSHLLFQDGLADTVVPRPALQALARGASGARAVRWYRAGHGLNRRAYSEQLAWLARELRLDRRSAH